MKKLSLIIFTIIDFLIVNAQTSISYEYDNLNRLTKVTYPKGIVVKYTYDVMGNRTQKQVLAAIDNVIEGDAATVAYWFDNETGMHTAQIGNDGNFSFFADVTALDEAFHTLHVMVTNDENLWSVPTSKMIYFSRGKQKAKLAYWFDNNFEAAQQLQSTTAVETIDVAGLSEGLHMIHLAEVDATDQFSSIQSAVFAKYPVKKELEFSFWFDNDINGQQHYSADRGLYQLDVTSLPEGFHVLHVQCRNKAGNIANAYSHAFIKAPVASSNAFVYFFDNNEDELYSLEALNGTHSIDISHLSNGFHAIHLLQQDISGEGNTSTTYFYKADISDVEGYYWFDDNSEKRSRIPELDGDFEIPVWFLSKGQHSITFQLTDCEGRQLGLYTAIFDKETEMSLNFPTSDETQVILYDINGRRLKEAIPGQVTIIVKMNSQGKCSISKIMAQ